ncbi:hypothetical protein GCM10022212_25560 [Actimicrobium antarcticum]|uniref:Uncharacterized protein n=1 Tax=Actimicrobium antarcticum TaxID=1051899 RepID=A0ABP7THR2_9BURK
MHYVSAEVAKASSTIETNCGPSRQTGCKWLGQVGYDPLIPPATAVEDGEGGLRNSTPELESGLSWQVTRPMKPIPDVTAPDTWVA